MRFSIITVLMLLVFAAPASAGQHRLTQSDAIRALERSRGWIAEGFSLPRSDVRVLECDDVAPFFCYVSTTNPDPTITDEQWLHVVSGRNCRRVKITTPFDEPPIYRNGCARSA